MAPQTVRLWSMELEEHLSNLVCYRGHNAAVWDVATSPHAPYFATASHDRTARLWSVEHAAPLRVFAGCASAPRPPPVLVGHTGRGAVLTSVGFRRHLSDVDAVAFHPNAHYLATGSVDKSLRLWELRAGPCVRVLAAHTPIHALAFSPCGQYLAAAGGGDGAVLLWCGPLRILSNPVGVAPTRSLIESPVQGHSGGQGRCDAPARGRRGRCWAAVCLVVGLLGLREDARRRALRRCRDAVGLRYAPNSR